MAERPFRFEAIVPSKPIHAIKVRDTVQAMRNFGLDTQRHIKRYPPDAGYRRTGKLKRGWTIEGPKIVVRDLIEIVGNNVGYAGRVQGLKMKSPRQSEPWISIGWASIEDVGNTKFKEHQPRIERALQGR